MDLGTLKMVPPRNKWKHEASDFTPWLASNIEKLNAEIGLELEVENTEVAVGPYSADILAKDTGTDRYVVIENQLEKTNHDHLGKSITYASVLDASLIIWIATDFTEEHKKALDWLNDHTDEDISFLGVQLELWSIDDSKPAVRFNIVSKPNLAVRNAAKMKAFEELSDSRKFQYDFWVQFRDLLKDTKQIPSLQTPRPQYWFDIALGKSHIHLSATCSTELNQIGLRVYIGNKIAETMLPYLEGKKAEIEKKVGMTLQWNPNPKSIDKTIVAIHKADFSSEKKVNDALEWLVKNAVVFRKVFSSIIRDS